MSNTKITFPFLSEMTGYPQLERLIYRYNHDRNEDIIFEIIDEIIRLITTENGMKIVLATKSTHVEGNKISWTPQYVSGKDETKWIPVFTSQKESEKGSKTDIVPSPITALFDFIINENRDGIVINPWGEGFMLNKKMVEYIIAELKRAKSSTAKEPVSCDECEDNDSDIYAKATKAKTTIDLLCFIVDKVTADNEVIKANIGNMKVSNLLRMDFVKLLLSMTKNIESLTEEEYEYINFVFGVDKNTIEHIYNDTAFSWLDFVREAPISLQIVSVFDKVITPLLSELDDVESLQSQIISTYKNLGNDYLGFESADYAHKNLVLEFFMNNIATWIQSNNNS